MAQRGGISCLRRITAPSATSANGTATASSCIGDPWDRVASPLANNSKANPIHSTASSNTAMRTATWVSGRCDGPSSRTMPISTGKALTAMHRPMAIAPSARSPFGVVQFGSTEK